METVLQKRYRGRIARDNTIEWKEVLPLWSLVLEPKAVLRIPISRIRFIELCQCFQLRDVEGKGDSGVAFQRGQVVLVDYGLQEKDANRRVTSWISL